MGLLGGWGFGWALSRWRAAAMCRSRTKRIKCTPSSLCCACELQCCAMLCCALPESMRDPPPTLTTHSPLNETHTLTRSPLPPPLKRTHILTHQQGRPSGAGLHPPRPHRLPARPSAVHPIRWPAARHTPLRARSSSSSRPRHNPPGREPQPHQPQHLCCVHAAGAGRAAGVSQGPASAGGAAVHGQWALDPRCVCLLSRFFGVCRFAGSVRLLGFRVFSGCSQVGGEGGGRDQEGWTG